MSSSEKNQEIWEQISKIGTGMLVTQSEGHVRGRPMQLVQEGYDGKLWFFTQSKTEEVKGEQEVCVTFSDPKAGVYVSLSGKARVIRDPKKINEFWNPVVSAWFPSGPDECSLLEIDVGQGESWSSDVSTVGFFFSVAEALAPGKPSESLANQKF